MNYTDSLHSSLYIVEDIAFLIVKKDSYLIYTLLDTKQCSLKLKSN